MKLTKLIATAAILLASASASAECYIALSLCKPMGIRSAKTFADSEAAANANPARCLQRAREYLNYCKSNQQVGADFYVNGVYTIGAYVTPSSSSLWTKSKGGQWLQVQSSY